MSADTWLTRWIAHMTRQAAAIEVVKGAPPGLELEHGDLMEEMLASADFASARRMAYLILSQAPATALRAALDSRETAEVLAMLAELLPSYEKILRAMLVIFEAARTGATAYVVARPDGAEIVAGAKERLAVELRKQPAPAVVKP